MYPVFWIFWHVSYYIFDLIQTILQDPPLSSGILRLSNIRRIKFLIHPGAPPPPTRHNFKAVQIIVYIKYEEITRSPRRDIGAQRAHC